MKIVCYGGGQDEWKSWWYTVFPLFFSSMVLALFVPAAIYLLCKTRRKIASKTAKKTLNHLGFRLAFYYFGILFTMTMIVFMAWRNNSVRSALTDAAETRFECMVFGGTFEECNKGFHMPEYTFWCLYVSLLCACLSTVVVTMHAKQIKRWINICPCLKNILRFGDTYCDCSDKDHVLMKIIDGTYFNTVKEKANSSQRSQEDTSRSSVKDSGTNNISSKTGSGSSQGNSKLSQPRINIATKNKNKKMEKNNSKISGTGNDHDDYKTKTKKKAIVTDIPIVINDGSSKVNTIELESADTHATVPTQLELSFVNYANCCLP